MRIAKNMTQRPPRHSFRAQCQVVRERDFCLVADRMYDLSSWGMLVGPADPVLTGERVYVSFELPGGRYIDTMATITRVLHGRRPGERTRKLGLEFDPLSPYDRFCIRRALLDSPIAPPGVRPGRRRPVDLRALVA